MNPELLTPFPLGVLSPRVFRLFTADVAVATTVGTKTLSTLSSATQQRSPTKIQSFTSFYLYKARLSPNNISRATSNVVIPSDDFLYHYFHPQTSQPPKPPSRCLKFQRSRTSKPPRKSQPSQWIQYHHHHHHHHQPDIASKLTLQTSTPQNTPANNAPISSHAQQPGVGTIKEGMSFAFAPHRRLLYTC